jgi:hypothetical protein
MEKVQMSELRYQNFGFDMRNLCGEGSFRKWKNMWEDNIKLNLMEIVTYKACDMNIDGSGNACYLNLLGFIIPGSL